MFINIIIGILIIILLLFIHEVCHFLIFRLQGVKVIAISVFIFHLIKSKFYIGFSGRYSLGGFNIIDVSNFDSKFKLEKLEKKITVNHIIVTFINIFILLGSIYFIIYDIENVRLIFILRVSIVINSLIILNAIFSDYGDLKIIVNFRKKKSILLTYLASSEKINGFKNDWVYKQIISLLESYNNNSQETDYIQLIILIDYIIDYNIMNYRKYSVLKYITPDNVLPLQMRKYLLFKIFIMKLATQEEHFKGYSDQQRYELVTSSYYKEYYFLVNQKHQLNDLKVIEKIVGRKYGVFSKTAQVKVLFKIMNNSILTIK